MKMMDHTLHHCLTTDESMCDEDEEASDVDYGFMVNDNYDPYDDINFDDHEYDEENYFLKLYQNGETYVDKKFGEIELRPWQLFVDKQHLRDVVRDYCIQNHFAVIVLSANNIKWTVTCSAANCSWRLHASVLPDGITWAIKSIQNSEHTCVGIEERNPMADAKWAAKVLEDDIRANNDISMKSLNNLLSSRYGITMTKSPLYRAKQLALQEIHGRHDVSYSILPAYCEVIKKCNPNSYAICSWNDATHVERPLAFTSIFIAFRGPVQGLLAGCRSLIGVDGAHLKGEFGGVLLSAVALDANNEIFPFAWAIVSGEDEVAWRFFLHHIKNLVQEGGREDNWCIISDRQKVYFVT